MNQDITLQINLSPGDVNYAGLTVPALVNQHPGIQKRLLVVDCCRPQKTKIVDPDTRFPLAKFNENVDKIIGISKTLLADKIVTDVYYLKPNDPLINHLSKKYLRSLYKSTHGAGGTANMGYWAGFELPETRYVLHYDGDVMLYQKPGYNWATDALQYMQGDEAILMAVPRLCPPFAADIPSLQEGRPASSHAGYWLNNWFSTRHCLLDKKRLEQYLPIVEGKVLAELLLRRYTGRAFPLDPEIVLFKSIAPRGGKRLVLKSEDAWLLHPADKSAAYLEVLPQVVSSITQGKFPEAQKGYEDLDLSAWLKFLKS